MAAVPDAEPDRLKSSGRGFAGLGDNVGLRGACDQGECARKDAETRHEWAPGTEAGSAPPRLPGVLGLSMCT